MGGKHATSSSQVSIPPEVLARYNAVNSRAETAASNPFKSYGSQPSDFVAQMNAQQNAGIADINATAGSYQPYMDAAKTATTGAMGASYENIDKYMSPYIQNVADTTGAMMRQSNEQAQSGALGAAAASGAFGGDRAGVAAANMNRQNQMAMGSTMANIYNQGYGQAMGAHQADLARQMTGGQQLAGLGAQSQALGLQGAQAKMTAGTMQQRTEQAGKDAMRDRFMQEQGYPFQVAQFLANIAMGTGALSGSTTTSKQPLDMWGNPYASGGSVDSGGVAGPRKSISAAIGGEGYVPNGDLPISQLLIAETPTHDSSSSAGNGKNFIDAAKLVSGFASGGAAGGRHGYATDGFVDPFGVPPQDASPAWSSEDEATHNAAIAAAKAALHPTAPTGVVAAAPNRMMAYQANHVSAPISTPSTAPVYHETIGGKNASVYNGGFPVHPTDLGSIHRQQVEALAPGSAVGLVPDVPPVPVPFDMAKVLASMTSYPRPTASIHPGPTPSSDGVAGATLFDANGSHVQSVTTPEQRQAQNGTPAGGVVTPQPYVQAPPVVQPADKQAAADPFHYSLAFTLKSEGGLNPRDTNGTPSMYGINQAAHPEVDVTKLTRQQAEQIYLHDYWQPINGDALAAKDPQLARAVFDTAVMTGVDKAKDLLDQSGGDTQKFLQLRASFLDGLLQHDPQKYGKYAAAWNSRTIGLGGPNMMNGGGEGGVGAADMSAQKPYDERNAVGKFFHNPDGSMSQTGISSFLAGLAGMTTGHTVASSILRGLGAGAEAYQTTQNQQSDLAAKNIANLNNIWTNYQNYIQSPNAQNVPFAQYAQSAGYNGPIPAGMQGSAGNSATAPGGQYNVSAFTDTSNLSTLSNGSQVLHANDPAWLTKFITANQSYTQPNVAKAVEEARINLANMMTTGYTIGADGNRVILPDQERLAAQQGLQSVKVKTLSDMAETAGAIGSTYPMQQQMIGSIVDHLPDINTGPQAGITSFIQNTALELGLPAGSDADATGFVNSQLNNLLSGTTGSGLASIDPEVVRTLIGGQGVNIGTNMQTVVSQLGAVQGLLRYNKDFSEYFNSLPDDQKTDPNQIRSAFEKTHNIRQYVQDATKEIASKANSAPSGNSSAAPKSIAGSSRENPIIVTGPEQYNSAPSGSWVKDSNGNVGIKP